MGKDNWVSGSASPFHNPFLFLATYYKTVLKIEIKTWNFPRPAKRIKEVNNRRHSWNPCHQDTIHELKSPPNAPGFSTDLEAAKPIIWISVWLITLPIISVHSSNIFICRHVADTQGRLQYYEMKSSSYVAKMHFSTLTLVPVRFFFFSWL